LHLLSLLVEETNRYYQQYLVVLDDGPSPLPDVTESEMFLFLVIIVQMRHAVQGSLSDLLVTIEQLLAPFYSSTMKREWFFYIIRFLHFSNNDSGADKSDPNRVRLWKLKNVFDFLNKAYLKYYPPSECLAVDEVFQRKGKFQTGHE
jgi:hypothetical protein